MKNLSNITNDEKIKTGCPRHGSEFLVVKGREVYCAAPTPGEWVDTCYWHPMPEKQRLCSHCRREGKEVPVETGSAYCRHHKNIVQALARKRYHRGDIVLKAVRG